VTAAPAEATAVRAAPPEKRSKVKPWVWGVIGGGIAAVAIGLGVGLGVGLGSNSGSATPPSPSLGTFPGN